MKLDSNEFKWLNFHMDVETNKLLTESAKRSGRKKRSEAEIRLKDHLKNFRSIPEVGHAIPFDEVKKAKS